MAGSRLQKGMIQVQGERAALLHVGWEHEGYLLQKITITSDDTLLFISSEDPNQQELEIHEMGCSLSNLNVFIL